MPETDTPFGPFNADAPPPQPPADGPTVGSAAAEAAGTLLGLVISTIIWSVVVWLSLDLLGGVDLALREGAGLGLLLNVAVYNARRGV